MKAFLFLFIVFIQLIFSQLVFSNDEPIIVTSERFKRDYSLSTSSILKYSGEEIEESGATNVADFLKGMEGINLFTSGPFGKASSLFLRGTSNRHTLIMVDGVRVTDLTAIGGGSRLEFLNTQNIESIEVLKGSQGVLYGAEAIGGVIKITTKKKTANKVLAKLGSYNQRSLGAVTNLARGKGQAILSVSHDKAEGISSFNQDKVSMAEGEAEKDGYENLNLRLNVGQKHMGNVYKLNGSYQKSKSDFDSGTGDVLGNKSSYQASSVSFSWLKSISSLINPNFLFEERFVKTDSSIVSSNVNTQYVYEGSTSRAEIINKAYLSEKFDFISGLSFEKEKAKALDTILPIEESRERISAYGHFRYDHSFGASEVFAEAGGRYENIQDVKDEGLYRFALGFKRDAYTLKVNQSTGFKSPSLYQSFSSFGSLNLKVEKSKSREISLFYKRSRFQGELTLFDIYYSNYIDFDALLNRYANLGAQNNKGIELSASSVWKDLSWSINANFLRAVDPTTGEYALRRPREKFTASIDTPFGEKFNLGLQGVYVGSRQDTGNFRMPSYLKFDAFMGYNDNVNRVTLNLNNILNRKYEEIKNFGTPNRNFLLSFERTI
jgi:vitamin B12 transporter